MYENQQYRSNDEYRPPARYHEAPASLSAMAVTALVLGIVALLTSFLPIINNISFFLALLGVIFGIVAVVATVRGTRRGKPLAIAALVLNIVAAMVVLATQAMFSAAIDEATSSPSAVGTSMEEPSAEPAPSESQADYSNLAMGATAELENGLSVSVTSIETGLTNYDGSAITGVTVSYTNNGSKEASFGSLDWKAQDAQGAQRNTTFYSEAADDLNSGSLAPGGTVSGSIYFDGEVNKVLYYSNMFYDSTVAWTVA